MTDIRSRHVLPTGTRVWVWVGLTLIGYPDEGVVLQYIEDYPFGPVYEVEFPPNDFVPSACLKPEWVFQMEPPHD